MSLGLNHRVTLRFLVMIALSAVYLQADSADAASRRRNRKRVEKVIHCPVPVRCQDEIWTVSTVHLGCPRRGELSEPCWRVRRYLPGVGWQTSTATEFFAGQSPDVINTNYVHGYRVEPCETIDRGLYVYRLLTSDSCDCSPCDRVLRHVIWVWPSDKSDAGGRPIKKVVRDVNLKANRAYVDAYYMGWWLSQFHPHTEVNLMGFSYGSRVILGALDLVGGGTWCGRALPLGGHNPSIRADVFAFAAALPCNALSPGGVDQRAANVIDCLVNVYNPRDPVLKRFSNLVPSDNVCPMGYVGVPASARVRYKNVNAARSIGTHHDFMRYVSSPGLMSHMRAMVFNDCRAGDCATAACHKVSATNDRAADSSCEQPNCSNCKTAARACIDAFADATLTEDA